MKFIYDAYAWLIERRCFYVFCFFVALLPLVGAGARRAIRSNSNDVSAWLPDAYPETAALNWYQEKFNHGSDHVVLLSWGECRLRDDWREFVGDKYDKLVEEHPEKYSYQNQALYLSDQRLPLLAEKLLSKGDGPALFADVVTGPEMLIQLTAKYDREKQAEQIAKGKTPNGLGLDPETALHRLEGTLVGPNYLHGLKLDRDAQDRAVIEAVEIGSQASKLDLRVGDVVQSVNERPTPTYEAAVEELRGVYNDGEDSGKFKIAVAGSHGSHAEEMTWEAPKPGRQTCALVTLSEYAVGDKRLRGSVARIAELAQQCDIPTDRANPDMLRMGGPPIDNVSIDIEGERTLIRLAILSFIVGLIMCWLCFRDVKITLMVFLSALFSEGTSLALVWYTGGRVDAILMSMPSLIYVLTISGAIHIVNYYRDSVVETGVATAASRAVAKGFVPCLLAAATTAVGLASLYISPLMPIRNFGVYSAISVLTSLIWIFLFVPAVLQLWPMSEKKVLQLKKKAALAAADPASAADNPWARIGEWMKWAPRNRRLYPSPQCAGDGGLCRRAGFLRRGYSAEDDDQRHANETLLRRRRHHPRLHLAGVQTRRAGADGGGAARGQHGARRCDGPADRRNIHLDLYRFQRREAQHGAAALRRPEPPGATSVARRRPAARGRQDVRQRARLIYEISVNGRRRHP